MVCFNPTNFAYSWKRKIPDFFEIQGFTSFCLLKKWCHQESNRGHKDFQSFALPTELWHLVLITGAKVNIVFNFTRIRWEKNRIVLKGREVMDCFLKKMADFICRFDFITTFAAVIIKATGCSTVG